jgi:DNA-binding NtrC family response regulator
MDNLSRRLAMRVLLIDDNEDIRMFARHILEAAGFEVVEAADGDKGIRLFRSGGADAVVTDLFMPGRDGLEVIKEISLVSPGVGIVASSGGGYGGQLDMLPIARHLGAIEILPKPFRPAQLLAAVEKALRAVPVA